MHCLGSGDVRPGLILSIISPLGRFGIGGNDDSAGLLSVLRPEKTQLATQLFNRRRLNLPFKGDFAPLVSRGGDFDVDWANSCFLRPLVLGGDGGCAKKWLRFFF